MRARCLESDSKAGQDFPDGMPPVEGPPILRWHGHRVFDVEDVPGLIALAEIGALLEVAAQSQLITDPREIRSASDRHLYEFGHRLQFGCCRERHGQHEGDDAA